MKRVSIFMMVLLFGLAASAQMKFSMPKEHVAKDTVLTIEGKSFDVNISINGAYYIERISQKTGNLYKTYLGYYTGCQFKGVMVFRDAESEKYWYLALSSTGWPKKKYIIKN